jgi:4-hydroxy-3-methylbut-2-enyl diphosphate reductase
MKILIAKTAGFCMGVRRAVEMALDAPARHQKPIYTFGPLIHNPQVLALFKEKGVSVLERIPETAKGTVLIRAHGVPPKTKQLLRKAGFSVIDATCPRVVKVQSIIKQHARKGYATIIVGDQDHPEVTGLMGFAGDLGHVVPDLQAFKDLPQFAQAIVVAQTTQNQNLYGQIKQWAADHRPHYTVFDTICDSTAKRQREVSQLSRCVDAVVVVGGKNSGNTQRLADIVKASGKAVYHVETEAELDMDTLFNLQSIGITAGASTPSWIIKRVLRALEYIPLDRRKGWRSYLLRAQRFLLLTNIYVSMGAGALCYAAIRLQGLPVSEHALAVAVLYVMSMHTLNHLTGGAEDKYNDPDRERFYSRNKRPLTAMAMAAGATGLFAAFQMGPVPFWVLLAMSLLGLSYNLSLIPDQVFASVKFRRIRDFPGSKTILITLAWGIVTAVLPALASAENQLVAPAAAFILSAGIVFGRTAFFDILDIQGDRIVGKETLPIVLGQKRSFRLVKVLLSAIVVLFPLTAAAGLLNPLAYPLAVCPMLLLIVVMGYQRGNMLPGMHMEFIVESIFILSGLLAFIFTLTG